MQMSRDSCTGVMRGPRLDAIARSHEIAYSIALNTCAAKVYSHVPHAYAASICHRTARGPWRSLNILTSDISLHLATFVRLGCAVDNGSTDGQITTVAQPREA